MPGGQPLVEEVGQLPDEVGTDFVQQIAARQEPQEASQGEVLADPLHQGLEFVPRQAADAPLEQVMSALAGPLPLQLNLHGLQAFRGQVHQFLGVQPVPAQVQPFQAGAPEVGDALALPQATGGQQPGAHFRGDIGLKTLQGTHLLEFPGQLVIGDGLQWVKQGQQVDIAAQDRTRRCREEVFAGGQGRFPVQDRHQIPPLDAAPTIVGAELLWAEIARGAVQAMGLGQGLGKGQMLEAVEGVVVDKILERGLTGQDVIQMRDGGQDARAVVGLGLRRGRWTWMGQGSIPFRRPRGRRRNGRRWPPRAAGWRRERGQAAGNRR